MKPGPPAEGWDEYPLARRREMARALAILFSAGPSTGLLALAVPHWSGTNEVAILCLIGAAYLVAAYVALSRPPPPAWAFQAIVATGTLLISAAAYFAGGTGTMAFGLFYTWVGLYAFLYFSLRARFAHLAMAGLAYGVVLAMAPHVSAPAAEWLLAIGTATAAGVVVGSLADRVRRLALHDPLTNLPNRRLFADRASLAIGAAERSHSRVALVIVDLDHFKQFNDRLGHPAGDQLLAGIARQLGDAVRKGDTVARLGGDEFAVLLTDVRTAAAARDKCEQLQRALHRALDTNGTKVRASLGLALYPDDADGLEHLMQAADAAMYRDKRSPASAEQ